MFYQISTIQTYQIKYNYIKIRNLDLSKINTVKNKRFRF